MLFELRTYTVKPGATPRRGGYAMVKAREEYPATRATSRKDDYGKS